MQASITNDTAWLEAELRFATARGKAASPRTIEAYSSTLRALLGYCGKRISMVTRTDVLGFFAAKKLAGAVHNSLAAYDRILRTVFAKAQAVGQVETNPMVDLPRLRAERTNKRKLSEDQARQLLLSQPRLTQPIDDRNYTILALMLMAGLRVSEVVNLRSDEVDLERSELRLQTTKGSKPRVVYIPLVLTAHLQEWLDVRISQASAASFFGLPGHRLDRRKLFDVVRKAGTRIGISDLHPHMLRRSYGSIAHSRGAPLAFLQAQYGHSDVKTTMEYIDIDSETSGRLAEQYCAL